MIKLKLWVVVLTRTHTIFFRAMIILINSSFYTKSGVFKRVLDDKDMLYIMMADSI